MANSKIDEKNLWKWLSMIQPVFGPLLHMERIENITGKGTPDVHGCYNGKAFTIELKAIPRRKLIDCEISEHQEFWALRRFHAGGNHWFLIQVGSGSTAKRYMIMGRYARALRTPLTEDFLMGLTPFGQEILLPDDMLRIAANA